MMPNSNGKHIPTKRWKLTEITVEINKDRSEGTDHIFTINDISISLMEPWFVLTGSTELKYQQGCQPQVLRKLYRW